MARPAKVDQQLVLSQAMRLFWQRGWSGTSISHLEKELDLTAPTLYRHFGSKEGLFIACIEKYISSVINQRIERFLSPSHPNPLQGLKQFCTSVIETSTTDDITGCFLSLTCGESNVIPAAAKSLVVDTLKQVQIALQEAIQRAISVNQIQPVNAEGLAMRFHSALLGLSIMARAGLPLEELTRQTEQVLKILEEWESVCDIAS